MRIILHFDGSAWPNPGGLARFGWTLYVPDKGHFKGNGLAGEGPLMSNNFAELFAMAEGLDMAIVYARPGDIIEVLGDSEVALYLMSGRYKARKEKLYYPAYTRCKGLEDIIHSHDVDVEYKWVPREQNQECDDLSKMPIQNISKELLDEAEAILL